MKKFITILLTSILATAVHAAYQPEVVQVRGYSTTANLGISGSYTSAVLSLENYTQVETHVLADTDGEVVVEWASDSGLTDIVRTLTIPYVSADGFQVFAAPAFTPYVRYIYNNNDTTAQTDFFFETKLVTRSINPQLLTTSSFISPQMVSSLSRSIVVGQDATGAFRNVPVDTEGHLSIHVTDPITSFGDLRVAELDPQVQLKFPYTINTDLVTVTEANGGTVIQTNSMAQLSTSAASNGSATMASRNVVTYRSGLGTLARFTGMFTDGTASSQQIIGIGDDDDGFFFGFNGTAFGVLTRRDGVDAWTTNTSFNVDILDGNDGPSNPSNMSLVETNLNVFQISFQWLGAGQIEFSVEDPTLGTFIPVHRVQYANNNQLPSIYNPSLSMYASVTNTGNTSDIKLSTASMAGFTEGKSLVTGPFNTYSSSAASGAAETLFNLENKATYGGKNNKTRILLKRLTTANNATATRKISVWINDALGAPTESWTDIDTNNSVVRWDETSTGDTAGDRLLFEATLAKGTGGQFELDSLGILPGEIVSVIADGADVDASITWQEDF